jgi:hypothetical protein
MRSCVRDMNQRWFRDESGYPNPCKDQVRLHGGADSFDNRAETKL